MNKRNYFWNVFLFMGIIAALMISCQVEDNPIPDPPRTYYYSLFLPNENGEVEFVADSIISPVASIGEVPSWCKITSVGLRDNHPIFKISFTESLPNEKGDAAKVMFTFSNDTKIQLQLNQHVNYVSDDNEEDPLMADFLNDWENQNEVYIFSDSKGGTAVSKEITTPWAENGVVGSIPTGISSDVKKENGWEMAFSLLHKKKFANVNYFGLYNRFYGILRVFLYVEDPGAMNTSYCLESILGSPSSAALRYPFYNTLQYGIPASHTNLPEQSLYYDAVGQNGTQTFSSFNTPYNSLSSGSLKVGWTAFDINMSGYMPKDVDFMNDNHVKFQFYCNTQSDASVSLLGLLEGNLSGSYKEPYTTTTSSSGVGTALKTVSDVAKGAGKAISTVAKVFKEDKKKGKEGAEKNSNAQTRSASAILSAITAAFNFGSYIYDTFIDDPQKEHVDGKIDLNLTGTIKLSGKISQSTPNSVPPVQIKAGVFQKNTNVGKGIWGLANDPVVYVVGDHCLAKARRGLVVTIRENNSYYLGNALGSELRMITFLDPNSIRLNLNTDIFPDISDVNIKAFHGIYPKETSGYTDVFRSLLSLTPPAIELVDRKKYGINDYASSSKGEFKMKLHTYGCKEADLYSSYFGETANNCSIIEQESKENFKLYYYGKYETDEVLGNKVFMPDPQVFFPISKDGDYVIDKFTPDFVVSVLVTFKSGGKTFFFSRRFVPKVEVISGTELDRKYADLNTYIDKSRSGKAISTLVNNSSVPVTHNVGYLLMEKAQKTLKTVLNK